MWNTTSRGLSARCAGAAYRPRWRTVWASACSALLLAAGCGGAERAGIPRESAEDLAAQTDAVAAALERGDPCEADRLADELAARAQAAAAVPDDYRAELVGAARSLADRVECPPPPPPPPPPAAEPADEDDEKDENDEKDDD